MTQPEEEQGSLLGGARAKELREHLNKVFNVEAFPEMKTLVDDAMKKLEEAATVDLLKRHIRGKP